jgi:hypothetical protein
MRKKCSEINLISGIGANINGSNEEENKLPNKFGIYLACKYKNVIDGSECEKLFSVSTKRLEEIQDKNLPIRCKKHISK